jgi:hypothetical protein
MGTWARWMGPAETNSVARPRGGARAPASTPGGPRERLRGRRPGRTGSAHADAAGGTGRRDREDARILCLHLAGLGSAGVRIARPPGGAHDADRRGSHRSGVHGRGARGGAATRGVRGRGRSRGLRRGVDEVRRGHRRAEGVPLAEGAARRRGRRVRPRRHPEQAPLRDGEGGARGGQARAVREAARHDLEGDGGAGRAREEAPEAGGGGELQHPVLPPVDRGPRAGARRGARQGPPRLGELRAGLAPPRHRLQLARPRRRGRRAAGGGRHRHPLAGSRARDHRPRGGGRLRRPPHRPPGPPAAERRGGRPRTTEGS